MAGAIPLVESGTAGYLGQVQPLLKVRPRARVRRLVSRDRDRTGPHRVLRLHPKADAQDVPGVHHPLDPVPAHPLHRLGKELPHGVSQSADPPRHVLPRHRAFC